MKKIILFLYFLIFSSSVIPEEGKEVPISRLGVGPWLGFLPSLEALLEGIKREKENLISYLLYDLREVGIRISLEEATNLAAAMEAAARKRRVWKVTIPDGTRFRSMGWKSRTTKKIYRTEFPVLRLGRDTSGYLLTLIAVAGSSFYKIEYIFLRECGNVALQGVEELPMKTEVPRQEVREREIIREIIKEIPILLPATPSVAAPVKKEIIPPPFSLVLGGGIGMGVTGRVTRDPGGFFLGLGDTPAGAAGGGIAASLGPPRELSLGLGLGYNFLRRRVGVTIGGGFSFPIRDLLDERERDRVAFGIGISLSWVITSPNRDARPWGWGGGVGYSFSSLEKEKKPQPPSVVTRSPRP